MLNSKTILITGGTGSFGKAFVEYIFAHYNQIKKVIIFSRDEQKQYKMMQRFSPQKYPIKYLLGDVRDAKRVDEVTRGVDIIIHSSAMKHVPASEQNPMECIKTNILGSQNIINSALLNNIKQVVALSTDKAVSPINVYGASKLLLEKLFVFANSQKEEQDIKFSVVRYGNIFGSDGSVIPFFLSKKDDDFLPITSDKMTRFSITMQESIDLVLYALQNAWGGEIIVPIAPSYHILDMAKAIAPKSEKRIIGIREGEKLDEIMLSKEESLYSVKRDNYYIICPTQSDWNREKYCNKFNLLPIESEFEYNSTDNNKWLSIEDIRGLIEREI
ncbi:MAG: UDP-N-acetylglucosamine 4,6-dehydratase (inverting) [Sulfurovum sp.]